MLLRILITVLRFIAARSERTELKHASVRSVLIIELSRLGDVISMLPAVQTLSAKFPAAVIHLIIDEQYHSLLSGLELDVELHAIERSGSFSGMIDALRVSRKIKADLAISMSPAKRNAIAALASSSRYIGGYLRYTNGLTPFLSNTPVESFGCRLPRQISYGRENIEFRSWKVLEALGFATEASHKIIKLGQGVCESQRAEMLKRGEIPRSPYVVIHPFSGWKYRTWGLDRFNSLAERIASSNQHDVVFLYSHIDEPNIRVTRAMFQGRDEIHFLPSHDLLHSAVLIKGAALFIGNDSGPLHLASLLGVPVVGLFGPAEPALTAPRAFQGSTVYEQVECSPCEQRRCVRPDNSCMGLISLDAVYSLVTRRLSSASERASVAHA